MTIENQKITFDCLERTLFEYGKGRGWDSKLAKWGKSGEQCLLAHALNTYAVAKKLCVKLERDLGLSDFTILVSLISAFVHDKNKETDEYQDQIGKETGLEHTTVKPEEVLQLKNTVKEILMNLDLKLKETSLQRMLDNAFTASAEHMKSEYDLANALKVLSDAHHRDSRVVNIVITADSIASWKTLDDVKREMPLFSGRYRLFYHRVSRIRGLLTSILHKTMERIAEKAGAEVLLTYPDGTLYLGDEDVFQSLSEKDIVLKVEKELHRTVSVIGEKVTNAILGRPGRTILKAPELINENNINLILMVASKRARTFLKAGGKSKEYIIKKLAIEKDPKNARKIIRESIKNSVKRWDSLTESELEKYRRKYLPTLSTQPDLRKTLIDAEDGRLVEAAGDGFILCVFAQYKKYLKEKLSSIGVQNLKKAFVSSFDEVLWDSLDSLGGNDYVKWRLGVIDHFWNLPAKKLDPSSNLSSIGLIEQAERRKLLVKKLADLLIKSGVFKAEVSSSNLKEIAELLVSSDLVTPTIGKSYILMDKKGKPRSASELISVYQKSKNVKEEEGICAICGLPGKLSIAVADLIGEGSESFTNKLPAGVIIGGKCKARICALCRQEGILRSMLGVPRAAEVVLLMPQVNTSREIFNITAKTFGEMAALSLKGYPPLTSYNELAVKATDNQINLNDISAFLPRKRPKIVLVRTETFLKDNFQNNIESVSQYLRTLGIKVPPEIGWGDIVTIFLDNVKLIEEKDHEFFSSLRESIKEDSSYVYETPHFAVVFRRSEIKLVIKKGKETAEESSSGAALRKLLIGLAFSKIMMCSVVFLSGLNILEEMVPRGVVKIPEVHNTLTLIREWTGRNANWVSMKWRDRLICLLGSIFTVASHTEFGVDSGFRSARLNTGELLRRLEMKKVNLYTQIRLLASLEMIERRYEGWEKLR
ncbi:MAG: hypothetical protein QW797_08015 [Thermoproteota archaeon]